MCHVNVELLHSTILLVEKLQLALVVAYQLMVYLPEDRDLGKAKVLEEVLDQGDD